jgi:hypothetical protein
MLDQIKVESNLQIIATEHGKIREDLCRQGKNIWTYAGRDWITKVMSWTTAGPTPPSGADDDRVTFMGFGIGGDRQNVSPLPVALDSDYRGQNLQTDGDPTITYLERPVRIDIYDASNDYWLREMSWSAGVPPCPEFINAPPIVSVRYYADFAAGEIDGPWGYPMVPLSEIGLFTYAYNDAAGEWAPLSGIGGVYDYASGPGYVGIRPVPIAYHTFYSIAKTPSVALHVRWEVRVGG